MAAVSYETTKAHFESKDYQNIQAFLLMNPSDIDRVMRENFKDNDFKEDKAKAETEKNLQDISHDLRKIMETYNNNLDHGLQWHTEKGFARLKDIKEKIQKIYETHKAKIDSTEKLAKWFKYFNDIVFRVEEIWNEKTSSGQKQNALEKLRLNRIETAKMFIESLVKFEKFIEEEMRKGEL
jgi:ElaB/YqjD/DUF883 family membrane-anchored ribosome-binding protein